MHIPDLSPQTYCHHPEDGFRYLSVGWLGDRVETPGETPPEVVARLMRLKATNQLPDDFRGLHRCELCLAEGRGRGLVRGRNLDKGEFFVQHGATRYVL